QNIQGAGGADVVHGERIGDALRDGGQGGEVEDGVAPGDRGGGIAGKGDAALEEGDVSAEGGDVFALSGGEVVEDADLVARVQKAGDQVGADETGAAGHETGFHGGVLVSRDGDRRAGSGRPAKSVKKVQKRPGNGMMFRRNVYFIEFSKRPSPLAAS